MVNSAGLIDGVSKVLTTDGPSGDGYKVIEQPLGTRRPLRIVAVGAGASGLNLARHVELHMENVELIIYEKNEDVGGTWFENRYPGCACDIPSHNYQFAWEPNPDWTSFYSPWSEILQYFRDIAKKYELYRFIQFKQQVTSATWSEDEGIWSLTINSLETQEETSDWCHILVNATGVLNNWKWPDVPGLHSFKGTLMHSAAWDENYDVTGKKVAVLGCGSSGVQIVPTIQPRRTPTWITAGFAQNHAGPGGANFDFSREQKDEFRRNPRKYLDYRKQIEGELNTRFRFVITESEEQKEAKQYSINDMKAKIKNESLSKHLIPEFAVGCRRPTPGNGYLEALSKENVRVVTDPITEIVPQGIKTSTNEVIEIDTFICATGFDISFTPRFKTTGRNNIILSEQWNGRPEAYLSLGVENFPNYFMYLGPNCPIGHGSVLPIIEHATKYFINLFKKIQTQNIKAVVPKSAAVRDFYEQTDKFMERTAWTTPCRSWFKNGKVDGPIIALHPGSRIHWFHMLEEIRYEDWEYTYLTRNRFQYLGNGFSTHEAPGLDTTFYFDHPESGYKDY
ncbi:hypothetical protein LTR84_005817 [Exophiala bonariae]|uniref:Uncharacterized protein n=1 Tax=Exophiala bonariae TaxID=1690606 RepID=A0AAV9N2V1_9EURO|nr:hypothetical protein LTR84_005817 [Exophiala bonariae]